MKPCAVCRRELLSVNPPSQPTCGRADCLAAKVPDTDILTEPEVAALAAGEHVSALGELARSHERLRGRLAEAERERDGLREGYGLQYKAIGRLLARLADAQAALAQLIWLAEDWDRKITEADLEPARAVLASSGTDSGKERATVCEECGSGLLDDEHIADYPCSRRDSGKGRTFSESESEVAMMRTGLTEGHDNFEEHSPEGCPACTALALLEWERREERRR